MKPRCSVKYKKGLYERGEHLKMRLTSRAATEPESEQSGGGRGEPEVTAPIFLHHSSERSEVSGEYLYQKRRREAVEALEGQARKELFTKSGWQFTQIFGRGQIR